ncbi:hypothetical protein [Rugosimonospora africana]|uniref:Uncharacterized protein n=1 Tax=Rugosimonospora africana TaxID=556532 RepID=A0A8J3R071_9ACTN|nr:hypothetical protein [Rugosimonospora africana]GIH17826.1 hypothetical protein Raf01_59980 [Rugosimonospora africana]
MRVKHTFLALVATGALIGGLVAAPATAATAATTAATAANGATIANGATAANRTAAANGNTAIPAAAGPTGIEGSAEGAIRESAARTDGARHIDTPTMISRITALHENTYDFLVESPTDWADLSTEFMPAAQAAGIRVFGYLVPPSECPSSSGHDGSCDGYLPYHKDYVAWGKALATLSVRYPDLVGWTVDDMDYNLTLFTASYVNSMNTAARSIAPNLSFYLQLYQPTITQSRIDSYAAGIAGVIMPYRDGAYRNTAWTGTFQSAVNSVTAILNRDSKQLIVMLYGNSLSSTDIPPDTDYVRTLTSQALADTASAQIAGVILWNLILDPTGRPANSATNQAHTGNGALVLTVAANTATSAGQYAQASTTIHLDSGSSSCVMVLHRRDSRPTSAPAGYHEREAYVGGHAVWKTDVTYDGTDWYSSSPLDITSDLTNGSASLVLRLTELTGVANYQVTMAFDDITLTGCGIANPTFETDSGWTISRSGGPVLASIYQYSPTYTTDTFAAVASLYNG